MAETFNRERGVVIIITFLTLGILLFLGTYFLSFSLTESRIAKSQEVATQTYYLAEAGINEAIWKLKNDDVWSTCFVSNSPEYGCLDCNSWQASFIKNYTPDSTTTISIQNSRCARGKITATSTVVLPKGRTAQRVVKTKVFKARGSLTKDSPIFGDGNVEVRASNLNVYDGNIWSSKNFTIELGSQVNIYDNPATAIQEGQALAIGNISTSTSILNSSSTCAANVCTELCEGYATGTTSCPPAEVDFPKVDFDSDDPNSYLNKAKTAQQNGQCKVLGKKVGEATTTLSTNCVFTQSKFEQLLWNVGEGGTLTLEHQASEFGTSTYYVTGNIELKGARHLVINGVLAADGNVYIGKDRSWKGDKGPSQLTINDPGAGIPSGLLAKGNVGFGRYSSFSNVQIVGLIYTLGNFELISLPNLYEIIGGQIAAGNFSLTSVSQGLNVYLDNTIIEEGIWGGPAPPEGGAPPYSPVVTIEHWEESY